MQSYLNDQETWLDVAPEKDIGYFLSWLFMFLGWE